MSDELESVEIKTEAEMLAALNRGYPVQQRSNDFAKWLGVSSEQQEPPIQPIVSTGFAGDEPEDIAERIKSLSADEAKELARYLNDRVCGD